MKAGTSWRSSLFHICKKTPLDGAFLFILTMMSMSLMVSWGSGFCVCRFQHGTDLCHGKTGDIVGCDVRILFLQFQQQTVSSYG